MSLDNLMTQPKVILPPHEVFQNANLEIVRPAQNAVQYLTAAIVNIPRELQGQVRALRNNFEDTVGGALAIIPETGRMSHEHETKLAILIMLKVKEITDALENIPGLGSHISHSFKGEFVPMQSKRSTQNLLSPTYGGVIGWGIGARRIQKKVPAEVQKKLGEIDIIL